MILMILFTLWKYKYYWKFYESWNKNIGWNSRNYFDHEVRVLSPLFVLTFLENTKMSILNFSNSTAVLFIHCKKFLKIYIFYWSICPLKRILWKIWLYWSIYPLKKFCTKSIFISLSVLWKNCKNSKFIGQFILWKEFCKKSSYISLFVLWKIL